VGGGAGGRRDHAVVHDLVPVLAGDDAQEEEEGGERGAEVGVAAQVVARLDGAEEEDADERVHEHQQAHAADDEEALEEGVGDRLHQHFQCRLFGLCVLEVQV